VTADPARVVTVERMAGKVGAKDRAVTRAFPRFVESGKCSYLFVFPQFRTQKRCTLLLELL
jgi:hypothetical protein